MKKKDRQIVWDEHEYHGQKYYYGFYKRKKMFLIDVKCGVYLRAKIGRASCRERV